LLWGSAASLSVHDLRHYEGTPTSKTDSQRTP
jgi:hypothetical protein